MLGRRPHVLAIVALAAVLLAASAVGGTRSGNDTDATPEDSAAPTPTWSLRASVPEADAEPPAAALEPPATVAPSSPPMRAELGCPTEAGVTDRTIASFDRTPLALTVFRPAGACATNAVPVVLRLHGWGGSRWTAEHLDLLGVDGRYLRELLGAGFGVVAMDARGHGDSGGRSTFLDPDVDMRDMRIVVDWIAGHLDWVATEGSSGRRDIRLATLGTSYGGAAVLMLAATDARVDAVVPMVTWHDLNHAVAPNRSLMPPVMDALYTNGMRNVRMSPRLRAAFVEAKSTGRLPRALTEAFRLASPSTWNRSADTPILMFHAMRDRYFSLVEAEGNLEARTGDAWVVGIQAGHGPPDVVPEPTGLLAGSCSALSGRSVLLDFLAANLSSDADARGRMQATPTVNLVTDDGSCISADRWPPEATSYELSPITASTGPARIELLRASEEMNIAGTPLLTAETTLRANAEFAAGLLVSSGSRTELLGGLRSRIRTPDRLGDPMDSELPGVAVRLLPGDTLYLEIDTEGCGCEGPLLDGVRVELATVEPGA